jgi:hypothetical protein
MPKMSFIFALLPPGVFRFEVPRISATPVSSSLNRLYPVRRVAAQALLRPDTAKS